MSAIVKRLRYVRVHDSGLVGSLAIGSADTPVAVAEGNDGALYVTDDGGNCVWRISAQPSRPGSSR